MIENRGLIQYNAVIEEFFGDLLCVKAWYYSPDRVYSDRGDLYLPQCSIMVVGYLGI